MAGVDNSRNTVTEQICVPVGQPVEPCPGGRLVVSVSLPRFNTVMDCAEPPESAPVVVSLRSLGAPRLTQLRVSCRNELSISADQSGYWSQGSLMASDRADLVHDA